MNSSTGFTTVIVGCYFLHFGGDSVFTPIGALIIAIGVWGFFQS